MSLRHIIIILLISFCGCVTPNIPLPPPPIDTISFEMVDPQNQQVVIRGDKNLEYRGYLIFLYNLRSGQGVISQASPEDGSFETTPLPVQDRDQLELWATRQQDDQASDSTCIELSLADGNIYTCQ